MSSEQPGPAGGRALLCPPGGQGTPSRARPLTQGAFNPHLKGLFEGEGAGCQGNSPPPLPGNKGAARRAKNSVFFPRQRDWHILAAGAWRAIPQAAGPGCPGQGHSVWERSGSGCRAEGSSSRSTTPRPLSFRYILTRKSACSARTTSQKGPQMSGSEMDGPPELGGMGATEGTRSPPGCRAFWGEGYPGGGTCLAWEGLAQGPTVGL